MTTYNTSCVRCAKLSYVILRVILKQKCYVNTCPIVNRYIAKTILMLKDTVQYRTVSTLRNHHHAYSQLWQALLPRNSLLSTELCTQNGGGYSEQ